MHLRCITLISACVGRGFALVRINTSTDKLTESRTMNWEKILFFVAPLFENFSAAQPYLMLHCFIISSLSRTFDLSSQYLLELNALPDGWVNLLPSPGCFFFLRLCVKPTHYSKNRLGQKFAPKGFTPWACLLGQIGAFLNTLEKCFLATIRVSGALQYVPGGWPAKYLGLVKTIRCVHDIFGREITEYTVIYGVYIRFWPTLQVLWLEMLGVGGGGQRQLRFFMLSTFILHWPFPQKKHMLSQEHTSIQN